MNDCRLVAGRDVGGQPVDQAVHGGIAARLGVLEILLRPAADLPLEIIAGTAIVAKPDRCLIHIVNCGDRRVHRIEIGGPLGSRPLQDRPSPENPATPPTHYSKHYYHTRTS